MNGMWTIEEQKGRRGPVKPKGWRVEVQLLAQNSEVEPELRWTKVVLEGRGNLEEPEGSQSTVEPMGWRTEVESGSRRLEVNLRNPPANAELEAGRLEAAEWSHRTRSQGTEGNQRRRGRGTGWLRQKRKGEGGWLGPVAMKERDLERGGNSGV